jgi:hypothetical protein
VDNVSTKYATPISPTPALPLLPAHETLTAAVIRLEVSYNSDSKDNLIALHCSGHWLECGSKRSPLLALVRVSGLLQWG